jgi:hypothetical protein
MGATEAGARCSFIRNVKLLVYGMDKLFETALADAAYWQDFERLQELVPALKAAVETKSHRRTHPSRAERRRKRPSSRLCQPVLNQLDFHTWLDGAVQSRAFAERLKWA